MRLGISKSLAHSTPEEWARKHRKAGLRAVIFPLDCTTGTHKTIAEYKRAAEENDLMIAEVGVWCPLVCADEKVRKANMDYTVSQLQLADEVGARCCVNFIGTYMGVRTEDSDLNFTAEAYSATVETVRELIKRSGITKTKLCLESMRNSVPNTIESQLALVRDVNSDRFGVHLDPYNMIKTPAELEKSGDLLDEFFRVFDGKIVSCHGKDLLPDGAVVKEAMLGKGVFDNRRYFELLKAQDDLPLIIEHLNSTAEYMEAVELAKRYM